jgi:hypothetical protein
MVDLQKAAQKLRRRARTSRDFMEAEQIGLPFPKVMTYAHSLLGELFSSISITYVLLQNLGFAWIASAHFVCVISPLYRTN